VEAIKLGATDYLSKPLDFARLEQLLVGVRDDLERRRSLLAIETDVARRLEFCGMIGRGPAMQELFGMIRRLAPHVRTALVTGETGTGKELVARALHRMGPRRDRRFVAVNCSAVVETLFESELFGHMRGAFTGATENKPGLFELADNGTLFLDEIGELPTSVQAKLLRVLELGRSAPRRIARARRGQRARDRGDQPRPARRSRRRAVPQRSLLPAEHRRSEAAGAARAPRGHSVL
jgi:DNA-binding NtrC family response regulator